LQSGRLAVAPRKRKPDLRDYSQFACPSHSPVFTKVMGSAPVAVLS
jgi:hypothetical protein